LLTLELERTLTVAELIVFDTHIHGLGEEAQTPFPTFSADSAILDPAKWYSQVSV